MNPCVDAFKSYTVVKDDFYNAAVELDYLALLSDI